MHNANKTLKNRRGFIKAAGAVAAVANTDIISDFSGGAV
jgi:hypothetical protein